jgi:pantoate--beta-alanine ligase
MLLDISVVGVPTVRAADGLAFSSRNVYLSPVQRKAAVVLSQAVHRAQEAIGKGEQRQAALVEIMRSILHREDEARVQYADVVDAGTLQPIEEISPGQHVLAAVAVYFGNTRLIDSVFTQAPAKQGIEKHDEES